jgi:hypothetical protein
VSSLQINKRIEGDLILLKAQDAILPKTLFVNGNMNLSGCNNIRLPDSLRVTGNLDLSDTMIEHYRPNFVLMVILVSSVHEFTNCPKVSGLVLALIYGLAEL